MSGFLFGEIITGPLRSRRLGMSLGVNLLPLTRKWCNFDCIYCECGITADTMEGKPVLYPSAEVLQALESKLTLLCKQGQAPDSITFAGNGEPTLHPEFNAIIRGTIALRNTISPSSKVSVLSNATRLHSPQVAEALRLVDNNVLKLDAGTEPLFQSINRPAAGITLQNTLGQLLLLGGKLIIQTMLVRGLVNGIWVDNTTPKELDAWLEKIRAIRPRLVMLYPLDREAPYRDLQKVPAAEFQQLASRLQNMGIDADVYA